MSHETDLRELSQLLALIHTLNNDPDCIGIICQLPLPTDLQPYKNDICAAVHPLKDIDGLGGIICGWNQI